MLGAKLANTRNSLNGVFLAVFHLAIEPWFALKGICVLPQSLPGLRLHFSYCERNIGIVDDKRMG
jgi:hypothetical protein